MKKMIMYVGLAMLTLTALSCSNNADVTENNSDGYAPVTVSVNDFDLSFETFASRRATPVADYSSVKAITLAFYDSDDTEIYKVTQIRSDNTTYTTFGQFSCSLYKGSYTMVVLAYGSDNPITLTSKTNATFTNEPVRETFLYTQAVNITSTQPVALNATLNRVVARLGLISTDKRPTEAAKLRLTFSGGGEGLNPMTGFSTTNTSFSILVELSSAVGATIGIARHLFLNSDEQTMNVTIEVLDADNETISTRVVNNVLLQRNRYTQMTGALFSSSSSSSFSVETSWLSQVDVSF